jgi:hypothetical protein
MIRLTRWQRERDEPLIKPPAGGRVKVIVIADPAVRHLRLEQQRRAGSALGVGWSALAPVTGVG